nr:MAG TPA: hypothetical protein [Caudoviricetes sp.]
MSVIYGNPIFAGGGSKPQSGKWDERYKKICTPTLTNVSSAITVKALTCRDGYLYGIGNDSAGNIYKLYGGMNSNLSAVKISFSGAYNPIAITCDGINVVWACGLPQYKSRFMGWTDVNTFKTTNTQSTYLNLTNLVFGPADICSTVEDAAGYEPNIWIPGGANNKAGIWGANSTVLSGGGYYHTYNLPPFVSCCSWVQDTQYFDKPVVNPVFVAEDGHVASTTPIGTQSKEFTVTTRRYEKLNGAKMVRSLNGWLFIACRKSDGMYLYKVPKLNQIFERDMSSVIKGLKITSEELTILDMVYAGGVYIVAWKDGSGNVKVWQTTDPENDVGIYGLTVTLGSGFTARAMGADGTSICILADNGSRVQKAYAKIG